MAEASCARVLLYHSGEMELQETASFESHLPDCPACRDRVSLARKSKRAVGKLPGGAPPALLKTTVEQVLDSGDGGGAFGRFVAVAVIAAALWWGYQNYERFLPPPPEDTQTSSAQARPAKRLSMPKSDGRPVRVSRPLARGRSRSAERSLSDALPMPARPLQCDSRQSILAFKRYAWMRYGAGQPHMVYSADRYASCVCGAAAQNAGRPAAPPESSSPLPEPSCPDFAAGAVSQERYDRFMRGLLSAAKEYHARLPLSREQALKLAQCLCGAMPSVEGE